MRRSNDATKISARPSRLDRDPSAEPGPEGYRVREKQARPADAPPPKLPSAAEITAMAHRFRAHAQNIRNLLADIQAMEEQKWPVADASHEECLIERVNNMIRKLEVDTSDISTLEVDMTLASLIADVDTLADHLNPSVDQGEWIKAIIASDKSTTKKTGKQTKESSS